MFGTHNDVKKWKKVQLKKSRKKKLNWRFCIKFSPLPDKILNCDTSPWTDQGQNMSGKCHRNRLSKFWHKQTYKQKVSKCRNHANEGMINNNHHHHHWTAVVSRGWAKASACRLQVSLSCAVLCQIVLLQYLSRLSLHRLAGLPCRLFLRGPSVVFEAVDMPFHFSHLLTFPLAFPII